MLPTEQVSSWPDDDLLDLSKSLASFKNKDARWLAFSESEYFGRVAPLTKTEFLAKGGIERIFRDATAMHGAEISPELIRQYLQRGWVYEFDKPLPSNSTPKVGQESPRSNSSFLTLVVIATAGLIFGALLAEEQPKTLFMQKESYSTDEFASYEEKEMQRQIQAISSSKTIENLEGYRRLLELNPQKPHYRAKVDYYEDKSRKERAEAEAERRLTQSSATVSVSSLSEDEAKRKCQARLMSQESAITTICSTRSCINREAEQRFGSCMLGYGFGRL